MNASLYKSSFISSVTVLSVFWRLVSVLLTTDSFFVKTDTGTAQVDTHLKMRSQLTHNNFAQVYLKCPCPHCLKYFIFISWCAQLLSRGRLFATPWTVAHQALLSMEFFRHEHWSGLPFLTPIYILSLCLFSSYSMVSIAVIL